MHHDNIDNDISDLAVEDTGSDMIQSQVLAMRGSWRLAQNQSLSSKQFEILRKDEYSKML